MCMPSCGPMPPGGAGSQRVRPATGASRWPAHLQMGGVMVRTFPACETCYCPEVLSLEGFTGMAI